MAPTESAVEKAKRFIIKSSGLWLSFFGYTKTVSLKNLSLNKPETRYRYVASGSKLFAASMLSAALCIKPEPRASEFAPSNSEPCKHFNRTLSAYALDNHKSPGTIANRSQGLPHVPQLTALPVCHQHDRLTEPRQKLGLIVGNAKPETAAYAKRAIHPDRSAMSFHNSLRNCKAKTASAFHLMIVGAYLLEPLEN